MALLSVPKERNDPNSNICLLHFYVSPTYSKYLPPWSLWWRWLCFKWLQNLVCREHVQHICLSTLCVHLRAKKNFTRIFPFLQSILFSILSTSRFILEFSITVFYSFPTAFPSLSFLCNSDFFLFIFYPSISTSSMPSSLGSAANVIPDSTLASDDVFNTLNSPIPS